MEEGTHKMKVPRAHDSVGPGAKPAHFVEILHQSNF